jgi:peptide/nickel transport system substrate-binding protein
MRLKAYAILAVVLIASFAFSACAPATPQVIEKVVKETVVVEQTKVVKETVVVEQTKVVEKQVEKVVTATPVPPKGGGTFTIATTQALDNFDPHYNQFMVFQNTIARSIFDYLTRLGPDMTVQPMLAQKWDISEDGKTYTLTLRPNVKFHNGRALTADDVVYSLNRTKEQKTTFQSKLDPVDKIEAVDAKTVRITLKKTWAPFLEDLSVIAIVPKEASDTLKTKPIGSGPYKFKEWVPNDRLVLEKNKDYDVAGVGKADQIVIKFLPDMAVALTNLEAGQVDAVYEVDAASAQRFKGKAGFLFQSLPDSTSLYLYEMAPMSYKPLQDVKVRTALAMCIDKEAIKKNIYFGEGAIQWSSLPKSNWAYIEPAGPKYDPDGAKKLLAEAGYPNGFDLQVETISGVTIMENIATIWQASLAKAGVKLKINISDISTWLDKYINRKYQVIANWMNVHGDPNSMYDIILKPHLTDPNSYPNQEMLQLINDGASTVDQGRRKAIYAKLQQMIVDQMAPIIIVQAQPIIHLSSAKVKGWVMNARGDVFLDGIYVEK